MPPSFKRGDRVFVGIHINKVGTVDKVLPEYPNYQHLYDYVVEVDASYIKVMQHEIRLAVIEDFGVDIPGIGYRWFVQGRDCVNMYRKNVEFGFIYETFSEISGINWWLLQNSIKARHITVLEELLWAEIIKIKP